MMILISLAVFVATLLGGAFALRFKDKLHLILGFSAGAVIGVAFFDLMPEAINMGKGAYGVESILSLTALGFIIYMILDRYIVFHNHNEGHEHENKESKGVLGAGSLAVHSFLDGIAIGLAFQVSSMVGLIVAVAVLVHDFSDGVNTVGYILKNDGDRKSAFRWLLVDALAPVLGIFSTMFFTLSENSLGVMLALFSGFFLYIGASDLLPESHHAHPKKLTTVMTVVGIAVLYLAIRLANM